MWDVDLEAVLAGHPTLFVDELGVAHDTTWCAPSAGAALDWHQVYVGDDVGLRHCGRCFRDVRCRTV